MGEPWELPVKMATEHQALPASCSTGPVLGAYEPTRGSPAGAVSAEAQISAASIVQDQSCSRLASATDRADLAVTNRSSDLSRVIQPLDGVSTASAKSRPVEDASQPRSGWTVKSRRMATADVI